MISQIIKIAMVFFFCTLAHAQVSPECGQAIPICGNTPVNGGTHGFGMDDFNGQAASGCLERTSTGSIESNSAWYRFRTGASGQLGFNIGHDPGEDWDFALYRAEDCGQLGEPLRCNFFDNREQASFMGVGEDPSGNGDSLLFEPWLEVNAGEDYILMINNFSNVNSGFSIQFTGSIWETNPLDALDCSIIDNLLGAPVAACGNGPVILDGTSAGALGYQWYRDIGAGFQLIPGEVSSTYAATDSGLYRVLVDFGGTNLVSDVQVAFNEVPIAEPLSDEAFCLGSPQYFNLAAKDLEALGSQDPEDFMVSYHLSQSDAQTGVRALQKLHLPGPGQQTLFVRVSSLANPNCHDASQSFVLDAVEAPELDIPQDVTLCGAVGSVEIGELMPDSRYDYQWDNGEHTPSITVFQEGEYTLRVTHSSSGISCTTSRTVRVTNSVVPEISTIDIEDMRANNRVTIHTRTPGEFEFNMDGSDFQADNVFSGVAPGVHTVGLRDPYGCGEVWEEIVVVGFPSIFSPNGDVLNETWQLDGLSTLNAPIVTIYDRYGKLIKQMDQNDPGWDGSYNGMPLPSTDYWFKLSYMDGDGNRTYAKFLQSHFSLRR